MNPLWQRAVLLYQQQRWDLAEQACRELLLSDPNDSDGLWLLALCLDQREKFEEATVAARQAVTLAPEDPQTHYALAIVLFDRNHVQEAGHSIGEALRISPETSSYWGLLAQVYFKQERWRDALEAAERGLQFDPEQATCLNFKALSLNKLGRAALAGETLEAALARDPENAITHTNLGWTRIEKGQYREALDSFREALRLDPEIDSARQGILEAIKARNLLYRIMLRYALWMARLDSGMRWGVMIGGYMGYRFVSNIGRYFPAAAPYAGVIVTVYIAFVILTWLADPVFNLLMRLHPDGKYALSDKQIVQANWVGALLGVALASLVVYFSTGAITARCSALVFGLMIPPVLGALECEPGRPRNSMAAISVALFLVGMTGTSIVFLAETAPGMVTQEMASISRLCWLIFPFAALGSQFATSYFANMTVRR